MVHSSNPLALQGFPIDDAAAGVFAGREQELEQLNHYLISAKEGTGRCIIVSGEAGVGKTTLLERFAAQSLNNGAAFISKSFDNTPLYAPYQPFWQITEKLIEAGLIEHTTVIPPPPGIVAPSDKDHDQPVKTYDAESLYSLNTSYQLAQQRIIKGILTASRKKPLIISLSNAHLASLTAWQFLHYLSKNIIEHKVLFIVTLQGNNDELKNGKNTDYKDILRRMNRERLVEHIRLNRFNEKEVRQLLFKIYKSTDFNWQFVDLLQEVSLGIPGRLLKYLQLLHSHGFVFQKEGIWLNRENVSREALIEQYNKVHNAPAAAFQMKDYSTTQKKILQYAALCNGSLDHTLLAVLVNISRLKIIKEILVLKDRDVLDSVDNERFHFKHPDIRLKILRQVPAARTKTMHAKIARAIEDSDQLDTNKKAFLLAHHYACTDDKKSAFKYLCLAGELALANFAFAEARQFFKEAMSLWETSSRDITTNDYIRLLMKSAWPNRALGYRKAALEQYRTALDLCKGEADDSLKCQINMQLGFTYFQLNDWENAREFFEKCLTCRDDEDNFIRAMANYGLGNIAFEMSDFSKSRQFFEEGVKLAKSSDYNFLMAKIFNNLGALENVSGNRLQAIALYSKCIPIFENIGDNASLAKIYHNIGMTYADEKQWIKAIEFYGKSLAASDEMGHIPLKSITFLNRALALVHLKQFDEATEYNAKAYRLLEWLNDELGLAEYYKIRGMIERDQANTAEARNHLNLALKKFNSMQNKLGEAEVEYEMGLLASVVNDEGEKRLWLNKAKERYLELGIKEKVTLINTHLENSPSYR